ncbi:MAG: hypothetical protein AAGA30_15535 [Planctomycetota bacterium]
MNTIETAPIPPVQLPRMAPQGPIGEQESGVKAWIFKLLSGLHWD